MNMKIEVLVIPVSDVDRSKAFYEKLGWRLDIDYARDADHRVVQFTPPGSEASIHIGKGITSATPGSVRNVYLVVSDIAKARTDLVGRGIEVSDPFHFDGLLGPPVAGPDPKRGSYGSFVSFKDPDGNSWLLQEITTRLPGREWESTATDVAIVAELLREAEQHHGNYEKTHGQHYWWDWYAPYLVARQNGSNPEDAIAASERRMDEVLHIPRK
jgi:catechol 2,3-dioxygenase-like lactoylglutathione lyase family enzyme